MDFFDPDEHYLFAGDRRGRYFSLKQGLETALGRHLSNRENEQLQAACTATGANDEMSVIQSLMNELQV